MPSVTKGLSLMSFKPAKTAGGFSLVELVLSMFVIIAIITILLTTSGSYNASRRSNLQSIAGKIAARQIETLRKMDYASLPPTGSFSDSDLTKLPGSTATQTISNFSGSADIKLVNIQINWQESGAARNIKMDTLIYKNGL